jgi:hypothetical protein
MAWLAPSSGIRDTFHSKQMQSADGNRKRHHLFSRRGGPRLGKVAAPCYAEQHPSWYSAKYNTDSPLSEFPGTSDSKLPSDTVTPTATSETTQRGGSRRCTPTGIPTPRPGDASSGCALPSRRSRPPRSHAGPQSNDIVHGNAQIPSAKSAPNSQHLVAFNCEPLDAADETSSSV